MNWKLIGRFEITEPEISIANIGEKIKSPEQSQIENPCSQPIIEMCRKGMGVMELEMSIIHNANAAAQSKGISSVFRHLV